MQRIITFETVQRPSALFRTERRRFEIEPLAVTSENLEHIGIPAWCDINNYLRELQATACGTPMLVEYGDLETDVPTPADTSVVGELTFPQQLPFDIVLSIHALYLHGERSLFV